MQLQTEAQLPTEINPSIPLGVEQITLRAMRKDASERYSSAAEMLRDLERIKKDPDLVFNNHVFVGLEYFANEGDELLEEAMKIVVEYQQASTSFIQRKLRVGFNRASRIMDELEERGVISEKDGSKPRQVLIEKEDMYDSQ